MTLVAEGHYSLETKRGASTVPGVWQSFLAASWSNHEFQASKSFRTRKQESARSLCVLLTVCLQGKNERCRSSLIGFPGKVFFDYNDGVILSHLFEALRKGNGDSEGLKPRQHPIRPIPWPKIASVFSAAEKKARRKRGKFGVGSLGSSLDL